MLSILIRILLIIGMAMLSWNIDAEVLKVKKYPTKQIPKEEKKSKSSRESEDKEQKKDEIMSKENKTKKIFRVEKDKNYSVIHNAIFLDKRISWGAKGVLGYALTKPDDWDLYISEVVKNGTDKKEKVSRYFRELRLAGYLDYRKIYEAGKIARTEYIISEKASHSNSIQFISKYMSKKLKPEIQVQEILNQEILSQENTPLLNTDYALNTDNNKILTPSLESKLKEIASKNKLTYSTDKKNELLFQNKLMVERCFTNEQIEQQAEKINVIAKNQFKPNWLMSDGFGFKFLAFNWDKIEALYNQSKPKDSDKKNGYTQAQRDMILQNYGKDVWAV